MTNDSTEQLAESMNGLGLQEPSEGLFTALWVTWGQFHR